MDKKTYLRLETHLCLEPRISSLLFWSGATFMMRRCGGHCGGGSAGVVG